MIGQDPLSHRMLDYIVKHKLLFLILATIGLSPLVAGLLIPEAGSIQQVLLFSFGTGVLSALVITFVSDFMDKDLFYDVLMNFQISVHEGGLVHESHREIPTREDAINKFFDAGQTAKIMTFTADNYIGDERVLELLKSRLTAGSKVFIILHTPIYNLRSYVDKISPFARYGKRHLSALELIRQQSLLFPKIEELESEFQDSFAVRITPIQLHIHTAIWGNRRIYSSLILRGTDGYDSPCIEVFPGLKNAQLFAHFERDFDYIWNRTDLTFSVGEIKPLYARLLSKYPMEVDLSDLDEDFITAVESEAAPILTRHHNRT